MLHPRDRGDNFSRWQTDPVQSGKLLGLEVSREGTLTLKFLVSSSAGPSSAGSSSAGSSSAGSSSALVSTSAKSLVAEYAEFEMKLKTMIQQDDVAPREANHCVPHQQLLDVDAAICRAPASATVEFRFGVANLGIRY